MKHFKELVQDARVYIANGCHKPFHEQPDFAFAFTWTGEGLEDKKYHSSFKFLVHPQLSYVSTDLLATMNNDEHTRCVADVLTGKVTATVLANKDYYFSPYGDLKSVDSQEFKRIYQAFLKNLPHLTWLNSVTEHEFNAINREWGLITLAVNK